MTVDEIRNTIQAYNENIPNQLLALRQEIAKVENEWIESKADLSPKQKLRFRELASQEYYDYGLNLYKFESYSKERLSWGNISNGYLWNSNSRETLEINNGNLSFLIGRYVGDWVETTRLELPLYLFESHANIYNYVAERGNKICQKLMKEEKDKEREEERKNQQNIENERKEFERLSKLHKEGKI